MAIRRRRTPATGRGSRDIVGGLVGSHHARPRKLRSVSSRRMTPDSLAPRRSPFAIQSVLAALWRISAINKERVQKYSFNGSFRLRFRLRLGLLSPFQFS